MLTSDTEDQVLLQLSKDISGELEPYSNPERKLKTDSVYVLMDNALKKIFLWISWWRIMKRYIIKSLS